MRRIITILCASFWALAAQAAITGTVPVTAPIAPTSTNVTYASHDEQYGLGGYRTVADTTARDAIPSGRLKPGMLVLTLDTGTVYQLDATTNWVTWATSWATNFLTAATSTNAIAALGVPLGGTGGYALTSDGANGFIWASVTNVSTLTELQLYNTDESAWNVITVIGTGSERTMQIETGGSGDGGAYQLIIWNADAAAWTTVKAAGSGTERGLTFEE